MCLRIDASNRCSLAVAALDASSSHCYGGGRVQCLWANTHSHTSIGTLFSTMTNLLTCYRGLFVCSSYMKECLIQLSDARWVCFFRLAPSAKRKQTMQKQRNKKMPHISCAQRYVEENRQPRCRCSQSSTQCESQNSPHRQTLVFRIDHSFLWCQGARRTKRNISTAVGKYALMEEKNKRVCRWDEDECLDIMIFCFFCGGYSVFYR